MADALRPILLVEDSPNDVELTLEALKDARLANDVVVVRRRRRGARIPVLHRRPMRGGTTASPRWCCSTSSCPRWTGSRCSRACVATHDNRHLPVVILTSSREEQDVVRGYQLGVNAFVVKPVGFQEFFRAIQDLGVFWAVLNEPPPRELSAGG